MGQHMNKLNMPKERQAGIDIYKILCCFLITTIHLFGYSEFLSAESITVPNFIVAGLLTAANRIGTSGFVFISGYYLSDKGTKINLKRIINFILELNFISLVIFLVVLLINKNFSLYLLIQSVFPLLTQHFWYPFNYIVLLLLSPYLNFFIEKVTKKQLLGIIAILISITCVFLKFDIFYSSSVFLGHSSHGFLWWILLYLSAAWYKRYGIRHTVFFGPVLFFASIVTGFVVIAVGKFVPFVNKFELLDDNSILGWVATCSSFVMFSNFKVKLGKNAAAVMRYIVPATFIAYLFQEHNSIREKLWLLVNINQYAQSPVYKLITVIALLFLILWAISVVIYMFYLLARKLYLDKISIKIENIITKFCMRLNTYFNEI